MIKIQMKISDGSKPCPETSNKHLVFFTIFFEQKIAQYLTKWRDLQFEYHETIFKSDHKKQTQTFTVTY